MSKILYSIGAKTEESVDIRIVCQPGNVHENMHRVAESVDTAFFVWLDEDIQILTDDWLDKLLQHFEDPTVGMVTCMQAKKESEVKPIVEHSLTVQNGGIEVAWAPGHVFAIRTLLLRNGVMPDRDIPGIKGMSDLDLCLQVRHKGFSVVCDERVVVWHPHKPEADEWRREDAQPTLSEEKAVFQSQFKYMTEKWGDFYHEALKRQVLADNRVMRV